MTDHITNRSTNQPMFRRTKQPAYHYNRLFNPSPPTNQTRSKTNQECRTEFRLYMEGAPFSTSHQEYGQVYLITSTMLEQFKRAMKQWINLNIKVRP